LGGAAADKALLLRALTPGSGEPRWRYLHLATHGFFGPLQADGRGNGRDGGASPDPLTYRRNPLLLSGLALARANADPDAGVLTAEEVASLDLRGTELVVLSACQSGLGRLSAGEGVLGLQRAFQAAGARSLVVSLWSVSDAATSVLMEQFYTNLWRKKMGTLEALRQAQLSVLNEPRLVTARHADLRSRGKIRVPLPPGGRMAAGRSPPAWWAAFVLSGAGSP
jgi:CHAT domain-containing protein